jgi:oxygen-dependent protoporphyrinogen oxidase
MNPPPQRTVAVIGGGIAGLSAAWELSGDTPDRRVVVFEGGERVGGKLRTETVGGREVDLGPDAFVVRRPEALALCTELGLAPDLVTPGVRRAYVWARGRLRPLPAGLALGVPTRLGPLARSGICSPTGLVRPALDLLRPAVGSGSAPGADGTVGEIVRRRLGREVTTRLAGPLIGGIHAGDVDAASAAAVFPALLDADRRPGSLMRALRPSMARGGAGPASGDTPVFMSLRGGLGRLVDELTGALERRGVEIRRRSSVDGLALRSGGEVRGWTIRTDGDEVDADGVVVAVPAPAAAGLLRPHDAALADTLDDVVYASVAVVTLRFGDDAVSRPLDGSGFLVPRGDRGVPDPLITACTWLTSKWPELQRPGDVLLRASVGRDGDDRHESLDDDELVRRAVDELGVMMGVRGAPLEVVVTRWPEAFPQYAVGHLSRVAAMEAAAGRFPSLALAGGALHGVGIPACIGSGVRAARAVLEGMHTASGVAR